MREIKFRAWDKEDKRMIIDEQGFIPVKVTNKGVLRLNPHHKESFWEFIDEERFEIMQYTGIKDKNGREIYEGDILLCTGKKGYWPERETVYKKSVIEWWQSHCNLGYRLRDGRGKTLMVKPSSLRTMQVEVIGNIYENPELLEGEE